MEFILHILGSTEIWVFNSREAAIVIITALALIWIYVKVPKIIKDGKKVIGSFFQPALTKLYASALIYSCFPVLILKYFNFWDPPLTKDLSLWFLFSAIPLLFKVSKCENSFFKDAFIDNIKLAVVIDFIVSQNTFNILLEITLVVFCIILGGIIAVSENSEQHKSVNKIFRSIANIIGLSLTIAAFYSLSQNISSIITIKKFEEFSLPIILGIWFIPFLYGTHLYIQYENVFRALNGQIQNKDVLKLAKLKSVVCHNISLPSLYRWKDSIMLDPPKTREDLLISFLDLKRQLLIERNPPDVDPSIGWCPYQAKSFLNSQGIETNHYKKIFENEWQAISSYTKLNNEIIENNLAYYVMGDSSTANHLKLVLNIYSIESEDSALYKFIECAKTIFDRAVNKPLPNEILTSIHNKIEANLVFSNAILSIRKTSHQRSLSSYTLIFELKTV